MQKINVGIVGGAGYTAGELLRILIYHPEAEIVFVNSSSNAGNLVTEVHGGLIGETDLKFTAELPLQQVDVLFLCTAHGDSKKFIEEHDVPFSVKIIDLSTDFREKRADHDFVYGLPELNRNEILSARHIANPGCFATAIQLGLLPLLILAGETTMFPFTKLLRISICTKSISRCISCNRLLDML
jgi:N-acetyl-gamma-glutamyl-phosphate reductase